MVKSIDDWTISDSSDNVFSISTTNPSLNITVTNPDGGETLTRGVNYTINWTSVGITGNVNLILFKGTQNLGQIAQNQSATGSYIWHVGDALVNPPGVTYGNGNDFRIMIKSIDNYTIYDVSDDYFIIQD